MSDDKIGGQELITPPVDLQLNANGDIPKTPTSPTSPHLAERFSMSSKPAPSPELEGQEIEKVWKTALGQGENWFLLDAKWWKNWCEFTGFNPNSGKVGEAKANSHRPGPIDNSALQSPDCQYAMKPGLAEHQDYNMVISAVWNKLLAWYSGGPHFPRNVELRGLNNTAHLDMYPVFLTFHDMDFETKDAVEGEGRFHYFRRKTKVIELIRYLKEVPEKEEGKEGKEGKEEKEEKKGKEEKEDVDDVHLWKNIDRKKGFRYYRFVSHRQRQAHWFQLARFEFFTEDGELAKPASCSAPGSNPPPAERASNLLLEDETKKFFAMQCNTGRFNVVFNFTDNIDLYGYRFMTANDCPERDPEIWTIEASNDQQDWLRVGSSDQLTSTSDNQEKETTEGQEAKDTDVSTAEGESDSKAEGEDDAKAAAEGPVPRARHTWTKNFPIEVPVWDLLYDSTYQVTLELAGLKVGTVVLVERKDAEGKWRKSQNIRPWDEFEVGDRIDVKDTVGKWYKASILEVKPAPGEGPVEQVYIHFDNWGNKWDEWIEKGSDRLAKIGDKTERKSIGGWRYTGDTDQGTPDAAGVVGLRNLGNTCFMNSTLQCLFQIPGKFTDFFVEGEYEEKINRDNPLGHKGKVADEFGGLLQQVWGSESRVVAPRSFKKTIGQFAPRFEGFQQQDSSELLSFLLDGLHEDLNQVKKKPPTNTVESDGRPDQEVAKEAWDTYLLRNQSIVVDHLQGQLRSELNCPECNRISITFDPFMMISVPLPTVQDKIQEVTVVFIDASKPPTTYAVVVPKIGSVVDLKKNLSTLCDFPAERMLIAEVWNHKIYKMIEDDERVKGFMANDQIYVFETPEIPSDQKDDMVPVPVIHRQLERNEHYNPDNKWASSKEYRTENCGLPRIVMLPQGKVPTSVIYRTIATAIFGNPDAEIPYKVQQLENDCHRCLTCEYSKFCDGCELTNEEGQTMDIETEIKRTYGGGEKIQVLCAFGLVWPSEGEENAYDESKDTPTKHESTAGGTTEKATISITDCLKEFTRKETLSENDPWYCSKCKKHQLATKKFDLWKLPDILIVHMKRFSYSRYHREKITSEVDFPLEGLKLGEFCVNEDEKDAEYDLFAVSNHMGGLGGGHYTAYAKNIKNSNWYELDDSRTSSADVKEVCSRSAYVLFYKKKK